MTEQEEINRRDFVKLTGGAVGAFVLTPFDKLLSQDRTIFTEQQITVGNLTLTAIVTEHSQGYWAINGSEVLRKLESFSFIIPEYFPPEYKDIAKKNPMLQAALDLVHYNSKNYGFQMIENWSYQNGKEIWVVDPMYSEEGVWLRAKEHARFAVGTGILEAGIGGFAYAGISTKRKDEKKGTISRRQAVKNILGIGVTSTILASGVGGFGVLLTAYSKTSEEVDIRHVYVARALIRLGELVPPGTRAATIYPPAHWYGEQVNSEPLFLRGILYYLTHPDDLKRQSALYEKSYPKSVYPDFYKIRRYQPQPEGWKRLPEILTASS